MGLFINLFGIGILVILTILIYFLVKELQTQNQPRNHQRRPQTSQKESASRINLSYLERQLLSMVGGERAIVQRLLENIPEEINYGI